MISDSLLSPNHERALTRSSSTLMFEDPGLREPPNGSYEEDWGFIPRPPYYGHDRDPALQALLRKHYLDMSPSTSVGGLKLPAFLVPNDKDKNSFGCDYALDMIQQTLLPDPELEIDGTKPPAPPRCFAVHGPGGMGNTKIAARFVGNHRQNPTLFSGHTQKTLPSFHKTSKTWRSGSALLQRILLMLPT